MALTYVDKAETIRQRLLVAHDPVIAKIRGEFFERELSLLHVAIKGQGVLVAGSGLGHDAVALAPSNEYVVGVELIPSFNECAREYARIAGVDNAYFLNGDFTKLPFSESGFDVAVLNMGTIGNFDRKQPVIEELLRISPRVFLDFYPPRNLERRRRMYVEERWQNVRVEGTAIVSDDGLDSVSICPAEISDAVTGLGASVEYRSLCDFALLAEIRR